MMQRVAGVLDAGQLGSRSVRSLARAVGVVAFGQYACQAGSDGFVVKSCWHLCWLVHREDTFCGSPMTCSSVFLMAVGIELELFQALRERPRRVRPFSSQSAQIR